MSKAGKFDTELVLDHRHKESRPAGEREAVDADYASTVIDHVTRTIAKPDTALQRLRFPYPHVDVLQVPSGFHRPWTTLVTCGMGAKPMQMPAARKEFSCIELCLCLPQDWPSLIDDNDDTKPGLGSWILPYLHYLARLPLEYDTWLGENHTIPNGDPPETLADESQLCSAFLVKPRRIRSLDFHCLRISDEKSVYFWGVMFITAEEMEFMQQKGVKPLMDKFRTAKVDELLQLERPSLCKKGLFGKFK